LAASFLELDGATLTADGGAGGNCAAALATGGGGGGGGRIKLRHRANGSFSAPATMAAALGPGGTGGGTTAPGVNGLAGTVNVVETSTLAKGVEAAVGPEEAL